MSDTRPKLMETKNQETRRTNGDYTDITIVIRNPHHYRDAINFVHNTGQHAEFLRQIAQIFSMFAVDALTHDVKVEISPDAPGRPSFCFAGYSKTTKQDWKQGKLILNGGLIYRDDQGWSIHT